MSRPTPRLVLPLALALSVAVAVAVSLALAGATVPAVQTPALAAVPSVCAGVVGCTEVATVDVDGDGSADQVGVAATSLDHDGSITVRVRTAAGPILQTTGPHVFWFDKPYVGAAPLDGAPGVELFVGDTMGASHLEYRVITYRAGRLVTLPAPPRVWTKAGFQHSTARWAIDGSYSFATGVSRTVSSTGVVRVTLKTSERNESGRGFSGHVTSYRWQDNGWVEDTAAKVSYRTDRSAFATGGWQVPGLRRFG
ncbi:MAG: hypothetical protein ABWY56_11370 [Propionibacteriaceae bacterium]